MAKGKVFISGKVSGMDYQEACRKFYDASATLMRFGFTPVVPVELCRSHWSWRSVWQYAFGICYGAKASVSSIIGKIVAARASNTALRSCWTRNSYIYDNRIER